MYALDVVVAAPAGKYNSALGQAELPWLVAKTLVVLLVGYLLWSDRVRFRQRVQAALMAQGGQVGSAAGIAARCFEGLAQKGINIRAITTSEIKISVLIDSAYTELAVRTLHSLYDLDG